MARMNLALSDALLAELRSAVPPRRRSAFVSQAVREKLDRFRQAQAVESSAGAWSEDGRDDPEDEVRGSREGWASRADG